MRIIRSVLLLIFAVTLVGCQAAYTSIEKRDLRVEVKQDQTIFMDPVIQARRTIYVSVRNTSGNPDLDMKSAIKFAIRNSTDYRLVSDPAKAYFILQVNVLHAERMDDASFNKSLSGGFGSGVVGGVAAGVATGSAGTGLVVGAATGAIGFLANTLVHDVYYTIVVDMEIRERAKGTTVTIRGKQNLQQGMGGGTTQTYSEESGYKTYRTRIVARANKVNLKEAEAMSAVRDRVAQVVVGSFSD